MCVCISIYIFPSKLWTVSTVSSWETNRHMIMYSSHCWRRSSLGQVVWNCVPKLRPLCFGRKMLNAPVTQLSPIVIDFPGVSSTIISIMCQVRLWVVYNHIENENMAKITESNHRFWVSAGYNSKGHIKLHTKFWSLTFSVFICACQCAFESNLISMHVSRSESYFYVAFAMHPI